MKDADGCEATHGKPSYPQLARPAQWRQLLGQSWSREASCQLRGTEVCARMALLLFAAIVRSIFIGASLPASSVDH
jgi:hypothetical protein